MDDYEQVLQDKMAISRTSKAFGVDTSTTPPPTGDEGGVTPYGEHSLHFKVILVPRGSARAAVDDGFWLWAKGFSGIFAIRHSPFQFQSHPASKPKYIDSDL